MSILYLFCYSVLLIIFSNKCSLGEKKQIQEMTINQLQIKDKEIELKKDLDEKIIDEKSRTEKKILILIPTEDESKLKKPIIVSAATSDTIENGNNIIFQEIEIDNVSEEIKAAELSEYDAAIVISTKNYKKLIKLDRNKLPVFSINTFEKCIKGDNSFCFSSFTKSKIVNLFSILKLQNRSQLAVLLPNNNKGFLTGEKIKELSEANHISVVNIEFYDEGEEKSIEKSITRIKNHLTHYFLVKNGKIFKKDLKSKNREKEEDKLLTKQKFQTDSFYIIGNDSDMETILSILNKNNLFSYNITYLTDLNINLDKISNKEYLRDFYFLGYNNPSELPTFYKKMINTSIETVYFLRKSIDFVTSFLIDEQLAKKIKIKKIIDTESQIMILDEKFNLQEVLKNISK